MWGREKPNVILNKKCKRAIVSLLGNIAFVSEVTHSRSAYPASNQRTPGWTGPLWNSLANAHYHSVLTASNQDPGKLTEFHSYHWADGYQESAEFAPTLICASCLLLKLRNVIKYYVK